MNEVKLGDRVHLKFDTEVKGTVVEFRGHEFRVTWDSTDRPRGRPRIRRWFLLADAFKTGLEMGNP